MRNNYFIILATVLILCSCMTVLAQVPRLIVLEHFTQASCGPCAAQNPPLKALLDQNKAKVVPIKYQTSWPGVDPMNAHNPQHVQSRVTYYGITGVPGVRMDGNVVSGSPGSINQTNINNRSSVTSPFDLKVNKTIANNVITVTAVVRKAATANIAPVLHLVVVEKEIVFQNAPGSNGEKEFNYVMKRMLPNANGTIVPITLAVGDSLTYTQTWSMANVYNVNNIEVVAFLQNNTSKEILQGAYTAFTPVQGNEASISRVIDSPLPSCSGKFTQRLRLLNRGTNNITTASISFTVNNGTPVSVSYTGSLTNGNSALITLPEFNLVSGSNIIKAYLNTVNGSLDQVRNNDTMVVTYNYSEPIIDNLQLPNSTLTFELATDRYGNETTWSVTNATGATLFSGGPYAVLGSNTIQVQPTQTWNLPTAQCINFQIIDSYGDGICCGFGQGYYNVRSGSTILYQGGNFGALDNKFFNINGVQGFTDVPSKDHFNIYPNPSDGMLNIEFPDLAGKDVEVIILNALGQNIRKYNVADPEFKLLSIDIQDQPSGLYYIQIFSNGERTVKKITLNK